MMGQSKAANNKAVCSHNNCDVELEAFRLSCFIRLTVYMKGHS